MGSERALCVQYCKLVARWQRYVALSYYLVFWTIFERFNPKNSPRHCSPAPAPARRIRRWRSLPRAHRLRVAVAVDGGDDAGAGGALAPAPPPPPCLAAAVKFSRHPPPAPSSSSFSHTPPSPASHPSSPSALKTVDAGHGVRVHMPDWRRFRRNVGRPEFREVVDRAAMGSVSLYCTSSGKAFSA